MVSGTTNSSSQFQCPSDPFELGLAGWVESAPIGRSIAYEEAARRIQTCKRHNSTKLNLSSLNLGTLPAEIQCLINLTHFDISENNLITIPAELRCLINLQYLYLSDNKLSTIGPEVGYLINLERLYLNKNQLTTIPSELRSLRNLRELDLSENNLTTIPTDLESLSNLQHLYLISNELTTIPPELGALFSLTELDLGYNPNLNEVPMALGHLANLTYISFDGTAVPEPMQTAVTQLQNAKRAANSTRELPARLKLWKSFANSTVDLSFIENLTGAATINEWLVRLERTKQFKHHQKELATTTCKILAFLLDNEEFSAMFMIAAEANNERCEDRAAQFFNLIYTHYQLCALPEDASIQDKLTLFLRAAKTLTLRDYVDTLIKVKEEQKTRALMEQNPQLPPDEAKKISEENEAVEIQLFVETSLKNNLDLLTAIDVSSYANRIGNRDFIDLAKIEEWVNEHHLDSLDELTGFTEFAKKADPDLAATLEILEPNDQYLKNRKAILKAWAQRSSKVL